MTFTTICKKCKGNSCLNSVTDDDDILQNITSNEDEVDVDVDEPDDPNEADQEYDCQEEDYEDKGCEDKDSGLPAPKRPRRCNQ